VVGLCGAV